MDALWKLIEETSDAMALVRDGQATMTRLETLERRLIAALDAYKAQPDFGVEFRKIVDALTFGVCVMNRDGRLVYANRTYFEMTEIPPDKVIGRSTDDIIQEGVYFKQAVSSFVFKQKKPVSMPMHLNAHGPHKGGFVDSFPIYDDEGELAYVATCIFDGESLGYRYSEYRRSIPRSALVRVGPEQAAEQESDSFIGSNPQIENIRQLAKKLSDTDVTVLITGESGTGKESVADYIFRRSRRRNKPFLKINCAAIPANLLEAELFGYERGAFTGALNTGKIGLLEKANHGTVMLDEVGDFPRELQPKLLRVLQQGEIYRVGGNTPIKLDVRFIAATNSDLKQKIRDGDFREDLYYRLSVFPVTVPPLRDRPGDIERLTYHFFRRFCREYGKTVDIPQEMMRAFQQYSWPGNIREMQNIIEYLIICTDDNEEVEMKHVKECLGRGARDGAPGDALEIPAANPEEGLFVLRDKYEKQIIEDALRTCGSMRKAAKKLGIYPSSLYRKVLKFNINVEQLQVEKD